VTPQVPEVAAALRAPPRWLAALDSAVILLLNLALLAEVLLVFLNTVLRAAFNVLITPGVDETSRLLLILIAFLGGAVAYGRGRFMAVTVLLARLPPEARDLATAAVAWVVIAVALIIGLSSIPLQIVNAAERTTILGIGYVWMTAPMTVGSALFVAHAGRVLTRHSGRAILGAALLVGALVGAIAITGGTIDPDSTGLRLGLTAMFLGGIAFGVPVGFVLAAIGISFVYTTGAAPMLAVAMNAQRGTGGFIFLALPFFILAGFIMDRGGIGTRIVNFLVALLGHVRGGLLQVMIVGMYVVSGISGSKAADMAAVGIPMRRMLGQAGYEPAESATVLAASAAMGESIPPSIAILALGSVTSISTGALFLAGLLPAATIGLGLLLLVHLRARLAGLQPGERAPMRAVAKSGVAAFIPLLMPVVLVGGIVSGTGTPTEVSSFAVIYGLAVGTLLYRQLDARGLWDVLTESALLSGMIFFTFAGATLFSWALTLGGVPDAIAGALGELGRNGFLPAVIAITVVLGALLESVVTVVILGPLLLPVAILLHVDPLQFGVVLIEAFGIGSIIPPVGLALYIACAICRTDVDSTMRPLLSFLAVLLLGLLVVAAVPWITLVLPVAFHMAG
jgi:tripartite ATP-independent transporter DctM subunit